MASFPMMRLSCRTSAPPPYIEIADAGCPMPPLYMHEAPADFFEDIAPPYTHEIDCAHLGDITEISEGAPPPYTQETNAYHELSVIRRLNAT
ncbi:hypothetical protein M413DRAFT_27033 [Hebeloma cylindrosporum]|uniref:Uncharacterized protein n=1 Tax=Hebeloma cylindrosporum TaxID=76867 RepID=A0A0C3CF52_HEBCY|nr:hypothetical protein M413DRAFT_27033 [Hebeloma cylindrosporum h7]